MSAAAGQFVRVAICDGPFAAGLPAHGAADVAPRGPVHAAAGVCAGLDRALLQQEQKA